MSAEFVVIRDKTNDNEKSWEEKKAELLPLVFHQILERSETVQSLPTKR